MNTLLLAWSITTAQILLGCAMACAVLRLMWGPRAQDRVLGLDTLYVNVMLLLITFGIQTGRTFYRSEEHTSELQSLMRISYAVFCLKKKKNKHKNNTH